LSDDFINALKKTEQGDYILGVDYPTYYTVIEQCRSASTREKLFKAYANRAYPHNEKLLQNIIAKRAELAQKLGFSSYAELDLADQMVGSPQRAHQFMIELKDKAQIKARQELEQFIKELPESVTLTADRKLQPWDSAFVVNNYKKKHYDIDEELIAEYFPMEKTIKGLFDIYQKFFSISFKQMPLSGVWHEEVSAVQVSNKDGDVLGYLLLDLYPRPFKYSHAAHMMVLPPSFVDGKPTRGIGVVLANFTKSTMDKPSLLKRREVSTFFHEFGHALHALLGRTELAAQAGTHVKTDFVELPSQMLEEWLFDKEILTMVSSHYKTGEQLPEQLIDKIIEAKNIAVANWVLGQLFYSQLSLCFFNEGPITDLQKRMKELRDEIIVSTVCDPEDRFYTNFGHLTEYAAKYYGYLWSKVFAKDLFAYIKEHGLLNPDVGQKYISAVLGKGGSKDPNELLKDFLGRDPSQEAFLKDIGLI
jgi:thimet oligopeptidase